MSSVQVLLSGLQDATRCPVERATAVLEELRALCRHDERRSEVVRSGTDVLLALAARDAVVGDVDALSALLELLLALMLDGPATRARLVQQGVLSVALRALRGGCEQRPSKRRNRLVRLAIDVVDQWSRCVETAGNVVKSESGDQGNAAIGLLLRIAGAAQEDAGVVLHAVEVLGCVIERDASRIATVARADGVAVLLRLLQTSVFRLFVHISHNPVDMPLLVNSETIEGLLALYISAGSMGRSSVLSTDLVRILSSLSRSTIESLSLKDEGNSLPSMFLCLRNHYDNLCFASQVYALLTKYWKEQTKSVHSITGFVGIAVDLLCRCTSSSVSMCDEMVEIYNFVRTVLLSKDGVEVVLSCGGKVLFDHLQAQTATCKPFDSGSGADDEEADADVDGNDDGSDGDGSDVEDDVVDINLELEPLGDGNQETVCDDELELHDEAAAVLQSAHLGDRVKPSPPKTFAVKGWSTNVEFAQYEDREFYFQSPSGIKYPKHPSRSQMGFSDSGDRDDDAAVGLPGKAIPGEPKSHFENLATAPNSSGGPPQNAKPEAYPYYVPEKSGRSECGDDSLTFDSCFESGNLARAVRIGEWEYDLFLRRDFNTTGHMQWFYFAVSNVCARGNSAMKYRFNIVNLCKPDSLFNQGLQPVVYSVRDAYEKRGGWRRSGSEIYYFSNPFPRSTKHGTKAAASNNDTRADAALSGQSQPAPVTETYFTLTFTLAFTSTEDTYLVAHSYPYTLSDHAMHLERIASRLGRRASSVLRRSALCKTLSGKDCELLSISDFAASTQEQKARRAVVISSRVHPGEAQASWVLRGAIDFLVGDSVTARVMRRMFMFQIIPMLNPDGVYYGNSRCSLAACDLNRVWHNPSQTYHPTIFHVKELLRSESSLRGVVFFCDLHGHSRKKNVFVYGCDTKKRPNPRARAFAKIFSMQPTARSFISLPGCSFKVSKSKETTARVVVANELKLAWCFTLEASFCGGSFGALQGMHYNAQHMQQVGSSLCEALLPACVNDESGREKLSALVDDYHVNVAALVDSALRENGVVSDSSGGLGATLEPREVTVDSVSPRTYMLEADGDIRDRAALPRAKMSGKKLRNKKKKGKKKAPAHGP
ncbi:hypothetical protein PybrP1_012669 [[Pythium] brassicae (nom. inval.)]|nr:hypothetical protein PybrP1_012669 [[Pythium] brassicae (nom. inval.)]